MAFNRAELKSAAREQIKGNIWLYFGLSIVLTLILSAVSFTGIGALLLAGPIELGCAMFMLEVVRTKKGNFSTGFKGFNQFGASFVATLLISIFVTLWTLLLVVPGIIAAFRYSMTFYILADNPEMSGYDAMKKSKEMMIGHKWELFVLGLSFIGWILLVSITFGIAAIYVQPYMEATVVNFYEKLKAE